MQYRCPQQCDGEGLSFGIWILICNYRCCYRIIAMHDACWCLLYYKSTSNWPCPLCGSALFEPDPFLGTVFIDFSGPRRSQMRSQFLGSRVLSFRLMFQFTPFQSTINNWIWGLVDVSLSLPQAGWCWSRASLVYYPVEESWRQLKNARCFSYLDGHLEQWKHLLR